MSDSDGRSGFEPQNTSHELSFTNTINSVLTSNEFFKSLAFMYIGDEMTFTSASFCKRLLTACEQAAC